MDYPQPGRLYKHYKGGIYEFLFLAPHTENDEIMVVYKSVLFGSYYVRPLHIWNEIIDKENKQKRFEVYNY